MDPRRERDLGDLCGSRRSFLRAMTAVGGVALLPGVLVACSAGTADDAAGGDAAPAVGSSVPASEVPVGQARVVDAGGARVVVAQPTAGEFVAYSSSCTHQGTPVESDEGLELVCPNHGSRFDATDGSVLNGPATRALGSLTVTAEGDQLVLG